MCNLYHHSIDNTAIINTLSQIGLKLDDTSRARNFAPDYTGADQDGPVITSDGTTAKIQTMRWGFPGIQKGDKRPKPITNIRNLDSRWWLNVNREFLFEQAYRCLVPFDRFAEWNKTSKGNAWFETTDHGPSFFAGIWRPWTGERLKPVEGKKRRERETDDWKLYAFLTTDPNGVVAPIHPKAMPVILTDPKECAEWLGGGVDSLELQRPLPDDSLALSEPSKSG